MTPNVKDVPGVYSPWVIDTAYTMMRRGILNFFVDAWRKHGDLVRIQIGSEARFLAAHPEHVRHVSVTNRKNYTKGASYDVVRQMLLGDGLVTSTGEVWRRQRKLMSPFFTPRAVAEFAPMMIADANDFIQRWEEKASAGEVVEMIDEMMLITAMIILRTMFSTESDEEMLELKDAVETMIQFVSRRQLNPIAAPLWLPTKGNQAYNRAVELIHDYIDAVVARRRGMPQSEWPDDLLSRLLAARDEETGEPMPDKLLKDEVITIFFAGHETTARSMAFTWYALSRNPHVAERLHQEIDAVLGDREPTLDDLKRMPYALRVIKETLRLYPPAPMYARDAIADDEIDGVHIPAGAPVILMPFCTHRHPDFWPEPERFDPDRWTPEREKARHPYAYHPFAAGQRVCIGNNFSLFESHILLTMLARRFNPQLVEGHQVELEMAGTLYAKNGMPMRLERR